MLKISQRHEGTAAPSARVELAYEARSRSRLRARISTGEEAAIVLDRGRVLRGGDLLLADDGRVVEVLAAPESVSTASGANAGALLRAAYHLGNRHVALQIGTGWLRYLHDHVLDDMVRGLGLAVNVEQAPFEPEAGAYGESGGGHHAQHD